MKRLGIVLSAALICSTLNIYAQSGVAQPGVVVSVNGTKILQKDIDTYVKNAQARGIKDSPELRQAITNDLVLREAIMQDIKKTGLEKKGENAERLKLAQQQMLQELWFEDYLKTNPINESDIRADYDRQANLTKEGRNSNEYKFSQIVVATEAEANELIKQLNAGASFENTAKEKSLEKTSGAQGGVVPNWVLPDMVTKTLGDALMNLSKGKVSAVPIQTNIGWHVIKLDETRKFTMPSYDDAKNNIYQGLLARKKQEAIDQLIKKSNITKPN